MVDLMNAIAQVSAAPVSGPKLDNRRVAAAVIDLLIVSAGAVAILVAGDSLSGDRQSALTAVILGWGLYYFFALESGEGQTLGKKLMKLRVVRADGRPAGMGEIAVRTVLRVVDNYLVGLIVMLATGERRQRVGDLAAGTIVVDASGPALASPPPAAVAEPDEMDDADAADVSEVDASAEEPVEDEPVEDEPVATQTITLPSRPAPPATLADLTDPEDEPEEAPEAEPVDEPVAEEPVVEVEPVVEDEAEELPSVSSPAIESLAQDVAATHSEPDVEDEAQADEPQDEEPVSVKSVETVSAIDLVMGSAEEQSSEGASESSQDAEDPASA
jgi:uncharacterized RDD family membrane protein YckC